VCSSDLKAAFDAGYNTMVILQGQAEKLASDMWEKSKTPTEAVKLFESTLGEYKKRRDDMKKMVDDSFNKFEAMIVP
jgi:phage shock protein A